MSPPCTREPFSCADWECVGYMSSAPKKHKDKVERYNDLLEKIYEHKLELAKMKSAPEDMCQEIVEDAQSLGVKAVDTNINGETSDNDSIDKEKKDKKRGGRVKAIVKGKGKNLEEVKGCRQGDGHNDVEWDYNLELSNSTRCGCHASDMSDSVKTPARNTVIMGSH